MSSAVRDITKGFPPIAAGDAHTLILGSLPSVQSVLARQYYGNPRNAFWKIMGELYGAHADLEYDERAAILSRNGVAVWDVLASSVRPGSLDADIDETTATVNDFKAFYSGQPAVRRVFFNGQAAAKLYRRRVLPDLVDNFSFLEYATLPSTSPAYAAMQFAAKLECWSAIRGENNVP